MLAQGSYNFPFGAGNLEPFIRYEHIDMDDWGAIATTNDEFDLVTIGVNWYHKKHASKFTADVMYILDNISDDMDLGQSGLGILDDNLGSDDQLVVRLQYQLLF